MSDVARAAGVSLMTASRVINKDEAVRPAARERVLAAIAELNYAPNAAARLLAGGNRARIMLLYGNPSGAYLGELLVGCLTEASRSDVQLLLEQFDLERDAPAFVNHLVNIGIDGVIVPPPFADFQTIRRALVTAGLPAAMFSTLPPDENMFALAIDDYRAAMDMTRHLLTLGHRRIGFIAGNPNQIASARRRDGYRQAFLDADIEVDESLIMQGDFSYKSGFAAAAALLKLSPPPTAIFASNDDMAAASIAAANRLHLNVPHDLSICGFDDTALATMVSPELTTVRQPVTEMGVAAVAMLAMAAARRRRADEPAAGQSHIFPHKLIQRQSDGPR